MIPKPSPFEQKVRYLEQIEYPRFRHSQVYHSAPRTYKQYSPSWHIGSGLIREEIVKDLRKSDKNVLSVGAGPAHLESYLVKYEGVRLEQISLADRWPWMPQEFERFYFDMWNPSTFPDFKKQFDYIWFPSSILLNHKVREGTEAIHYTADLIAHFLPHVKPKGQIRIDSHWLYQGDLEALRRRIYRKRPNLSMTANKKLIVVEKLSPLLHLVEPQEINNQAG